MPEPDIAKPKVGVLALQGAFREHRLALERLGASVTEIRLPEQLTGLAGVVIPGGESTTVTKLMVAYGFDTALLEFHAQGGAVWGTCAGAIVIAADVLGRPAQLKLSLLDISVDRNAYGRQVASFEVDVAMEGFAKPFGAVFIRAPRITRAGPDVTILASYGPDPILVRQDRVLASVFHPELSGDDRVHQYFLDML